VNDDRPVNQGCQMGSCRTIAETWIDYQTVQRTLHWGPVVKDHRVAVCGIHAAILRASGKVKS
jgi:hypothetical protein